MADIQFHQCAVEDTAKTGRLGKICYEDGIEAVIRTDSKSTLIYRFAAPRKGESMDAFKARVAAVAPILVQDQKEGDHVFSWWPNLQAYIEGKTFCDGTPLDQMTWLTPGQIETLRSCGVGSVERLANIGNGQLEAFGLDGLDLSRKAKAWLTDRRGESVARLYQQGEELEAVKAQNAELKDALQAMQAQVAALTAEKKRGRPAKAEATE